MRQPATILTTSILSAAIVILLVKILLPIGFFSSQIQSLIRKIGDDIGKNVTQQILTHTAAGGGDDSPATVRGGSIIARAPAPGIWQPVGMSTNLYSATVGKGTITISGQVISTNVTTPNGSWRVVITGRDKDGLVDATRSHGFVLCSEANCVAGSPSTVDTNLYLKIVDNQYDQFAMPDISDEAEPAVGGGGRVSRHRWAFHNASPSCNGSRKCDYISEVLVFTNPDPATPTYQTQCYNSACSVAIK